MSDLPLHSTKASLRLVDQFPDKGQATARMCHRRVQDAKNTSSEENTEAKETHPS